jgi:hypothetical protein
VKQLLVTWLENFRSKFEGRPEAQATIDEVRDALDLYTKVIDGSKGKLEVDRLRDARSPNSVLEYGIEYELRVFNGSIKKGIPTDDRFVDTYLTDLEKFNARLIEVLLEPTNLPCCLSFSFFVIDFGPTCSGWRIFVPKLVTTMKLRLRSKRLNRHSSLTRRKSEGPW